MKNILISNPKDFEKKKNLFLKDGKEKIHILTDFDRTLTKAYVHGKPQYSAIAFLRNKNYISKDYSEKANALADKYRPIEINPRISIEEKRDKMEEWWRKHFKLLIESGLNKKHLEKIVNEEIIEFREGALEFLDALYKNNMPLVIISSNGIGDIIPLILEKQKRLYSNIYILTNLYEWDKNGNAIKVKEPIIHIANKNEASIKKYPFYDKIKGKKNIILLGDSLGDLNMLAHGYKNLIKIGFLNDNIEENLESYRKNFDVLILNDGDMKYVNSLMKEIVKQ